MRYLAIGLMFVSSLSCTMAASRARWLPQDDVCENLDPYWTPCAGRVPDSTIPFTELEGYVLAGRPDVWEGAPDFLLSQEDRYWGFRGPMGHEGTPKAYMRSAVLADKGDTPDLALRRAGPDQSGPYGQPTPVPGGHGLGTIYWQAWGENCDGGEGWYAGCGGFGRVASIWAQTEGDQTASSRAGNLMFNTTPVNSPGNTVLRFQMSHDGQLIAYEAGDAENPTLAFAAGGEQEYGLYRTAAGVGVSIPGVSETVQGAEIRFPDSVGDTSMVLVLRTSSGVLETRPVRFGEPDTCGEGYRCLRVEN